MGKGNEVFTGSHPPGTADINQINARFHRQKEWFVQHSQMMSPAVSKAMTRFLRKREELRSQALYGHKGWDKMDAVNHPKHYNTGKIEVIEFLEDQRLGLHLGNVVKYVCRAGRKDKATRIQDLEKAVWYLQRKIELLKAKAEKRAAKRPNEMNEHPNCRCALPIWEVKIGSDGAGGRK